MRRAVLQRGGLQQEGTARAPVARHDLRARRARRSAIAASGSSEQTVPLPPSTIAPRNHAAGSTSPSPTTMGMPRARASIATWLVAAAAASARWRRPGSSRSRESAVGGDVLARPDRARPAACRAYADEMPQHAVAHVAEVCRAGAEIIVVGGLVARRSRRPAPQTRPHAAARSAGDSRECRRATAHRPPAWQAGRRACPAASPLDASPSAPRAPPWPLRWHAVSARRLRLRCSRTARSRQCRIDAQDGTGEDARRRRWPR